MVIKLIIKHLKYHKSQGGHFHQAAQSRSYKTLPELLLIGDGEDQNQERVNSNMIIPVYCRPYSQLRVHDFPLNFRNPRKV